jgi:TonB family protein
MHEWESRFGTLTHEALLLIYTEPIPDKMGWVKRAIVPSLILSFCLSPIHGQQVQISPSKTFRENEPIINPQILFKYQPVYAPWPSVPEEARLKHWSGTGKFTVYVWREGNVRQVQIAQSTGHAILDKSAVDALSKWRFRHRTVLKFTLSITFRP